MSGRNFLSDIRFKGVAAMWQTGVNLTYENNQLVYFFFVFGLRGTIIYNYLLFKNRIFLQHVSNFYSSSGNEREQKIILVEKVDTKTVIWQNGLFIFLCLLSLAEPQ